MPLMNLIMHS